MKNKPKLKLITAKPITIQQRETKEPIKTIPIPLLSIKDEKIGFEQPWVARNIASAIRGFEGGCKNEESPMTKHPKDYSLWKIGEFNEETAEITENKPIKIAEATDYVKEKK